MIHHSCRMLQTPQLSHRPPRGCSFLVRQIHSTVAFGPGETLGDGCPSEILAEPGFSLRSKSFRRPTQSGFAALCPGICAADIYVLVVGFQEGLHTFYALCLDICRNIAIPRFKDGCSALCLYEGIRLFTATPQQANGTN